MKTRVSIIIALLFALILPAVALPQVENRARLLIQEQARGAANASAAKSDYSPFNSSPRPRAEYSSSTSAGSATIESVVPRDGLQLYVEIRSEWLAQLAQSASALAPLMKMFTGSAKVSSQDFVAFAVSQMSALAQSRFALVSYDGKGAAVVEASTANDAEAIRMGLAKIFSSKSPTDANAMDVALRGRVVIAGERATVARLAEAEGALPIAEDQTFMKARERFAGDHFFAYAEVGAMPLFPTASDAGQSAAYMAGALAGLASRPYAVALGGSLEGDMARVRALALFNSNKGEGLFGGLFSSDSPVNEPAGASFASPNADLFIDVMLDWDKLYDSIQSMFATAAGAMGDAQLNGGMAGGDLFAMVESQLGFSIKYDLLPTLGRELSISFADFSKFAKPVVPQSATPDAGMPSSRPAIGLPRILIVAELRDPAKFEKLFTRIISPPNRPPAALSQESYRGATIKYRPSIAFTISRGFFLFAPSVAEIRRALDARATGNSLASTAEFRSAVATEGATMQAYISSGIANGFLKSALAQAAKSNAALQDFKPAAMRLRSGIGLTMKPDPEGLTIEMRVPTDLVLMALASVATAKPAPYGITTSGQRRSGSRRTPTLTTDDVTMTRKP